MKPNIANRWNSLPILVRLIMALGAVLFLTNVCFRLYHTIYLYYYQKKIQYPLVTYVQPKKQGVSETIILPGNLIAWHDTDVYSRVNGYIKKWYVDIGSQVKKGQLLAIIDTPELMAQYHYAKQKYLALKAKNHLAQLTAKRWQGLVKSDSVSIQETDEKVNLAQAIYADMLSAKAEKNRLQELIKFRKVTAPFSGTISDRNIDIGTLVNSGNQTNGERALFHLVKGDLLRLYIKIPQIYQHDFSPGLEVDLQFKQFPHKIFKARLLNMADAIDLSSRTLLTQFVVDNHEHLLLPGSYTTVHFCVSTHKNAFRIPINTLLFRQEGTQVAVITSQNTIHLKSVKIFRDFGNDVEISKGLEENDMVVINPFDDIFENQTVVGKPRETV